ncbi:MAG TPA: phosphoglucosamine mutase, partial [Pseudomonadales bacterium]
GGEGSGHILCLDLNTTGDGIVSALQVLAAMEFAGQSLAESRAGMEKLPQRLVNVGAARPGRVADDARVTQAVDAATHSLSGAGRVLLRPSGTEPLVRVMVEGQDASQVERIAEEIAAVVRAVAVG